MPNDRGRLFRAVSSRRDVLRVGSLAFGGLTLPNLLHARATADGGIAGPAFGRAKNVIFLWLAGGPPQHETWDPKPHAPAEIRGPFKPISTNIPGIHIGELLPRTSMLADKLAIVRSMATYDNTHSSSGAWVLTGYKYRGPNPRTITPTDWPWFGSLVKMLKPSRRLPALSSVWIPDVMRLNENVTPAGQSGGFLGSQWDPERFVGDPSEPSYEIESLRKTDVTYSRLTKRRDFLSRLDRSQRRGLEGGGIELYDTYRSQAFDLLTSGKARNAFAIDREPMPMRERYGMNRWGQCVLLARRLIEAGVRLVHVQWPREPGDNAVDNPLWDTHAQNADRLEDVLCPMFDVGFSALLHDLDERGLLDETLVVAIGEFGRTPKINAKGGRDHWGSVFSFAMAGAGIRGGQTYGESDKTGAFPASDRVQPGELTATIFHLLGIDSAGTFPDRLGRLHRLSEGEPLHQLLGTEPGTQLRTESTGDVARVPTFDPTRLLADADFSSISRFQPLNSPSRPKGWRAGPLVDDLGFGVKRTPSAATEESPAGCRLGLFGNGTDKLAIQKGGTSALTQEVRSPFAGTYVLRLTVSANADDEQFQQALLDHFQCRLQFFQFQSQQKDANQRRVLASIDFEPRFDGRTQTVELRKQFVNPTPGANFSFGSGLGIAVVLERRTGGDITLPPARRGGAALLVHRVELRFDGKTVDENVTV